MLHFIEPQSFVFFGEGVMIRLRDGHDFESVFKGKCLFDIISFVVYLHYVLKLHELRGRDHSKSPLVRVLQREYDALLLINVFHLGDATEG